MSPFFGSKIGEDQKKVSAKKISGFSIQMRLEVKQNEKKVFPTHKCTCGFTSLYGVTPKWCHLGRTAPPCEPTGLLFCYLCISITQIFLLQTCAWSFPNSFSKVNNQNCSIVITMPLWSTRATERGVQ